MRDGFYHKYWVYILSSRSGTLNTGLTGFFERRTTCRWPLHVRSKSRRWRREKKINLIEKFNPRWQDLAEKWGREMRFQGQSLVRIP